MRRRGAGVAPAGLRAAGHRACIIAFRGIMRNGRETFFRASANRMAAEARRSRFGRSLSERWRRSASIDKVERLWAKLRLHTIQGSPRL